LYHGTKFNGAQVEAAPSPYSNTYYILNMNNIYST
jgi:hypothetical protein